MSAKACLHERIDWVDYAKGFCIIFVVMMHSTLGVEAAIGNEGFMHYVVAFAKPFRMPDFFLISGLFLSRVIDRDWRSYFDRKVAHFAYFYVLWVTIQFAFKSTGLISQFGAREVLHQYFLAFVQPFGTLWFIYMLPVFFVFSKLFRNASRVGLWLFAALLELLHVDTGILIVDEFASRYVYFLTGYLLAPYIFMFARSVQSRPLVAGASLVLWGVANGLLVFFGYSQAPFVSLGLGLVGACAVVTAAALMATTDLFAPLRYCGRHSIVIYLTFFLPMAAARTLLIKTAVIANTGLISLIVTAVAVIGALALFWIARAYKWRFLFERPRIFWLRGTADATFVETA